MNKTQAAELTATAFHTADQVGHLMVARLAVSHVATRLDSGDSAAATLDAAAADLSIAEGAVQRAAETLLTLTTDQVDADLDTDAVFGRHALLTDLDELDHVTMVHPDPLDPPDMNTAPAYSGTPPTSAPAPDRAA